ncbi:hypothetical protein F5878DRAFT_729443 [Lentinula raphanica]|uniref:Uncharacterized protein n=1 Tax=Lentinula raphanica TaxID=153919 RepID=A0AA38U4G0_9AGAR|nr:hypothetical protein F5878DRAFT_729443 [Lentinula raphanica]
MTMFFLWAWGYIHLMLILLTSVHAAPLVTSIDDPPRDLVARQVHNQDSVFYNGERVYGPFKGYIWFNGEREPSHEYGVPSRQVRGQSEYQSLRVSETIRLSASRVVVLYDQGWNSCPGYRLWARRVVNLNTYE